MIRTRELIIKETHQFIFSLHECLDAQVFQAKNLEELGEYYYKKTLQSINGITEEMFNTHIKKIAFRRSEPKGINDYYRAICNIASIQRVPGPILDAVRKKYNKSGILRSNHYVHHSTNQRGHHYVHTSCHKRDVQASAGKAHFIEMLYKGFCVLGRNVFSFLT